MPTVFPKNNLPEPAQPWAREVQKQLANVITSNRANEINNATRDNQLNSSLISLSAAVNSANSAINGLISLGSSGSEYTLNADNINAGTITGVTLQTAASGRRVIISGTSASFYDDSGVFTGDVTSTGSSGSSILALSNVKNGGFGSSNTTRISLGQTSITLSTSVSGAFGAVTVTVGGAGLSVDGQLTGSSLQINNSGIAPASFTGAVSISQSLTSQSSVFFTGLSTTTNAANMRVATTGLRQVFEVTSSSQKYKNTITPLFEVAGINEDKLLELPVVGFKYNGDYLSEEDYRFNKMVPGFIAEQLYEIYPIAAEVEDGSPIDWNPRFIIPGMLALIQKLNKRIETLEKGA